MRGIYIASLNSQRLKDTLESNKYFDFKKEVNSLDVYVFDNFEILNGIFFNSNNAAEQKVDVESIIQKLEKQFMGKLSISNRLLRHSNEQRGMSEYLQTITNEYYTNNKFKMHCFNQIFQNLQPKLRRVDVTDNKSYLIELLVPFLLNEITVFLEIFDKQKYDKVFSLEHEMSIISAIEDKKYKAFEKYLKGKVEYITISKD